MQRRTLLAATLAAGIVLTSGVRAAPPEGKGQGHGGNPYRKGNKGQGNPNKAKQGDRRASYDSHGRNRNYFDDQRDGHGRPRSGDAYTDLIYAGITVSVARRYATDYGVGGYARLPPGIRRNLARGKPLPPGIAKKLVPEPLLGRLPIHDGYEWRVAGTDLILIAIGTAVVADILYDVFD